MLRSGTTIATAPLRACDRATHWATTCGRRIMSESMMRTYSPLLASTPRLRCALRSGPASRTTSANRSAICFVPSVEPLSTTTSSKSSYVCARMLRQALLERLGRVPGRDDDADASLHEILCRRARHADGRVEETGLARLAVGYPGRRVALPPSRALERRLRDSLSRRSLSSGSVCASRAPVRGGLALVSLHGGHGRARRSSRSSEHGRMPACSPTRSSATAATSR